MLAHDAPGQNRCGGRMTTTAANRPTVRTISRAALCLTIAVGLAALAQGATIEARLARTRAEAEIARLSARIPFGAAP